MSYNGYKRDFSSEFRFSASRSGGAGGQNVNKVNTKVELRFSIPESSILSDREKELLISSLFSLTVFEGLVGILLFTGRRPHLISE